MSYPFHFDNHKRALARLYRVMEQIDAWERRNPVRKPRKTKRGAHPVRLLGRQLNERTK